MSELTVRPVDRLAGEIRLPGDKSISHRALLISALAEGKSIITGLQSGADCLATRRVLAGLGVRIETLADGSVAVFGSGPAGFRASPSILDCANSGTTMRLMAGIAAGLPFATSLTGDASLRKRPMARVTVPLREMGARIQAEPGELPPLIIQGGRLTGREHRLTVASAQVKSCLLLAGLLAAGRTTVIEPAETRDHTERMLGYFGGRVERAGRTLSIEGGQRLAGRPVRVVGDFSAAAFFLAAGAIVPEAELVIPEVGLNPSRTAFLELLRRMGAVIEAEPGGETAGEPSGRL
ncbi:MAG TPA: 3-phosphoshikimate 1-carboxyvinyltransferase, partial [bacterium]|nr:3-phosphoshikimate 1-carboxyvinyltransferase [bacterium]